MGRSYRQRASRRSSADRQRRNRDRDKASAGKDRNITPPLIILATVVLLAGLSAYLYFSEKDDGESDGGEGPTTGDDDGIGPSVPAYMNIPLTNVDGGTITLEQYKGKVVLLDMFATWCAPCKTQMGELSTLQGYFQQDDLVIISVDVDLSETASMVRDLRDEEGADWTFALSTADFSEEFEASSIPTMYILDREGKVTKTHVGVTSSSVLQREISELL